MSNGCSPLLVWDEPSKLTPLTVRWDLREATLKGYTSSPIQSEIDGSTLFRVYGVRELETKGRLSELPNRFTGLVRGVLQTPFYITIH